MKGFYRQLLLLLLIQFSGMVKAQLTTSTNLTPAQLVQNVLLGGGVAATNITYNGDSSAIGSFTAVNTNLGVSSGIVMTTGTVSGSGGPAGPNNSGSSGVNNNYPGDNQLNSLTTAQTHNAAVLEFDFIPQSDTIMFRYVFGSEEYPEYVNSSFNDVFAFWLSGVTVPMAPVNLATIPSSMQPVTINNLNCQGNSPYYICNDPQDITCPPNYNCPIGNTTIQYDGFTTVLTAMAVVQCGEMYHIKIAIADVSDGVFDSGVFLEAGSFSAGSLHITSTTNNSSLYEGCGQTCLIFDRGQQNIANPDTLFLNFSGTALNGVDVTTIPSTLAFQPGQDTAMVCLTAFSDNLTEGSENLIINATAQATTPCGQMGSYYILPIGEYQPLNVTVSGSSAICSNTSTTLTANVTGGAQPYLYLWSTGAVINYINPAPSQTTSYSVTVNDACNNSASTAFTVEVDPPFDIYVSDQAACGPSAVNIFPLIYGGVPFFDFDWQTVNGPNTISPNPSGSGTLLPTADGTYLVTITDKCSTSVSQEFNVTYREICGVLVPNIFTPNGNGANETFVIKYLEYFPGSELKVYNRWGTKVYESADYMNDWNAEDVSDGVYYYILMLSDKTVYTGFVTILR